MTFPTHISVDAVLQCGRACQDDYPNRWQRQGALLFLALVIVPAGVAGVLSASAVPFAVAGEWFLVLQVLLTLAYIAERGRRHRWALLGALYRAWRQELMERDQEALCLLAGTAEAAAERLRRLGTVTALATAGLGGLACLTPELVLACLGRIVLAIGLAGLGYLVVAVQSAERTVCELARQPAALRNF